MRLDTAEKRAQYRACMIPKGSVRDERSSEAGEAYTYECAGKLLAIAFRGSAGRREFHYSYRNAAQRETRLAEFFASIARSQERKAKARAEKSAFVHDVQPGDIFRASWGYDQTNIDHYQCVRLVGSHMMEVREIGQQSEETGFMTGNCVPTPGAWATEAYYDGDAEAYKQAHGSYPRRDKAAFRVKIQGVSGEPCMKVDHQYAYREKPLAIVAGSPIYGASRWSSYA